jgi:hypothetical protein
VRGQQKAVKFAKEDNDETESQIGGCLMKNGILAPQRSIDCVRDIDAATVGKDDYGMKKLRTCLLGNENR